MTSVKESFKAINELGNYGYENAQKLGEINLRAVDKLINRQMEAMTLFMEAGLRQAEMIAEAKGFNDLVNGQIGLAKELGEKVMETGRENVRLAGETRDQYREWMEQSMEAVADKVSKTQQAA